MTARTARAVRSGVGVFLLVAAWLAATAWIRPLALPDEGRYVGVAWEMLRSGDWLVPTLDGLPFFHKPPLFYWLTAGSLALFGPHPGAARAASLLSAALLATALYLFVRRRAGRGVAAFVLAALITQPLFFGGAQFANLDMLVAACIGIAILAFAHAALATDTEPPARASLAAAYLFMALGVLAKGLIGVLLPLLVIAAWLAAQRQWRRLAGLVWWPGMALFLAVAVPWFVAMQLRFAEFFDYFFVVQHFRRFAQGVFNNVQPLWFFAAVLIVLTLPWTLWARRLFSRIYWRHPTLGAVRLLMGVWLLVIVVFFSLPQSKLVGYVLPACAPLAFLLGDAVQGAAAASARARRAWRVCLGLAALLCVSAIVAVAMAQRPPGAGVAQVLRDERRASEPVFFLEAYFYDLPLRAGLTGPVSVVDDWRAAARDPSDHWRKELSDAGRFAPGHRDQLLQRERLGQALCAWPVAWIVAPPAVQQRYPELASAERRGGDDGLALWRVARGVAGAARACPKMPNDDPTGK